jgi:type IV pilus assembly protein PilY1
MFKQSSHWLNLIKEKLEYGMKKVNAISYFNQGALSLVVIIFATLGAVKIVHAASTDISPAPVFTTATATTEVKPNIMFVLDDSGSMDRRYMPDEASDFLGRKGELSSQCNGVFYNPNITYMPPKKADGTSYPNSSWPNADRDGFDTSTSTANLSTQFSSYYNSSLNSANYYVYSGTQTSATQKTYRDSSSTFYNECRKSLTTNESYWTRKTVSSTSGPGGADERVNFANWFTYYRTRMQLMKTSAGRAFNQLDQHYRVGYLSLNNNTGSDFLNITDFNGTQKSDWYDKLYKAEPNSGTPLRESLAEAGLVYSGRATTINGRTVVDPVQYACQQNYTILSTDGYWNGNAGFKIDGTNVGNQDGVLPLPYNDGAFVDKTVVTPYVSTEDRETYSSGYTTTETYQQKVTTIGAACSTPAVVTPPNNTQGVYLDVGNGRRGAVGSSASDPSEWFEPCVNLGENAWFCRGTSYYGTVTNPPVNQAIVTQNTSGRKWYLVSDGARNNSKCISSRDAFGNGYSQDTGACFETVTPGISGSQVTVTPSTYTVTKTGATTSKIDRYKATQTTTQNITTTSSGPLGPLTPATPAFTFDSNISDSSTAATASSPPSAPITGAPTISCVATASLPTPGTSAPSLISSNNSGGATIGPNVVASSGPTAGTPIVTINSETPGVNNTLADVAAYYYYTNLRDWDGNGAMPSYCIGPIIPPATTPTNLCLQDKVPVNGNDTERSQHMTTFTLGLGAQGQMTFIPDYETNTSGDYDHVAKGKNKSASTCRWSDTLTQTGGRCNWPIPNADDLSAIDDLWHAAINGHGNYFNASDPTSLESALKSSLNVIQNTPQPGTAASAATTNPKITSANNYQFSSYFKSIEWSGELIRQSINLTTGAVPAYNHENPDPANYDWSAQTNLDNKVYTTRNIYTKSATANTAIPFTWASLSTAQQAYFKVPHISTNPPSFPSQLSGLSQFCPSGSDCISASAQSNVAGSATGQALVNFLRGDRSNEEGSAADQTKFYRNRASVLGDIVSAQPQYVGAPDKSYTDAGYSAFKTTWASRTPIVYAAANDGMLHAFSAATGDELWAYIPSFVLPRLYTLADKKYSNKHQYFVEGTPRTGDVKIGGVWKTILVGGLNAGGVGYYAIDITDPANPSLMWEFTDANMGYSFGNPNITKLDDATGTWVVTLTSGYNNCPTSVTGPPASADANCTKNGVGDGEGHLYVLNAANGNLVSAGDISTGVGTVTTPSGLSKVVAQGGDTNVSSRVYGGDLFGNLWRFDIGSGGYTKQILATFKDASGNPQPITARPQVTTLDGKTVVFVGTGKYLGTTDVDVTLQQSFYAIKDTGVNYGNPRSAANANDFISVTAVTGICPVGASVEICTQGSPIRSAVQNTGVAGDSIRNKKGWYLDFPIGEIAFTDPKLIAGTLIFSTSIPKSSTSAVCGSSTSDDPSSFGYQISFLNGGPIGGSGIIAKYLGQGIATEPQIAQLPSGEVVAKYKLSGGQEVIDKIRFGPGANVANRVSWKEFVE